MEARRAPARERHVWAPGGTMSHMVDDDPVLPESRTVRHFSQANPEGPGQGDFALYCVGWPTPSSG